MKTTDVYTRVYYPNSKGRYIFIRLKNNYSFDYAVGVIWRLYDSMVVLEQCHLITHDGIVAFRGTQVATVTDDIQYAWLMPRPYPMNP